MEKFVDIAYLISAVSFIYGLKTLSHPKTARNGNIIASIGMLIAIITTAILGTELNITMIISAMVIGTIIGSFFAIRVEMTQMPQLVAIFNGFGGAASALVASAEFLKNSNNLNAGVEPQRMGNGHPSIHPFRPYDTQNGQLNLCVGNDRIFEKLCIVLGHKEWFLDPLFSSNPQRVKHRKELNQLLEPIFVQKTKEEWREQLQKGGVPCDIVACIPEALEQAHIVEHKHPNDDELDSIKTLGLPFQIDGEPRCSSRRAPRLNEHYDEVLEEWLG